MKSNRISALNELLMEKLSQVFLYQKSNCSVLVCALPANTALPKN